MLMGLRVWRIVQTIWQSRFIRQRKNDLGRGQPVRRCEPPDAKNFYTSGRLQGISRSAGNAKISAGISQTGDFIMAQQRAAGAQHRHDHIDWEHMTDKQKFDFLYGWCHKLEATLDGRRKVIYGLNAELQKVLKKLEGEI
jgi:hypothetical protein